MTDETDYAASFVVVERNPPRSAAARVALPRGAGFAFAAAGGATLSERNVTVHSPLIIDIAGTS